MTYSTVNLFSVSPISLIINNKFSSVINKN